MKTIDQAKALLQEFLQVAECPKQTGATLIPNCQCRVCAVARKINVFLQPDPEPPMTSPKPSQPPWTTRGAISNGHIFIADIYAGPHFVGSFVGGTEAQANELANTAIAAHNSHSSLLSACEGALEIYRRHSGARDWTELDVEAFDKLQSAIAEAGGGKSKI